MRWLFESPVRRKGCSRRVTVSGVSRGRPRELPAPLGMPVPGGVKHRKAPERLPDQREPHGSCGSLVDPPVPGLVKDPEVPARRVMVRPDAEGGSARGEQRGRKPLCRPGKDALRRGLDGSGTTAVEPGWEGASAFEAAELSVSYSSEFETCGHRGRRGAGNAATRFGLTTRKSLARGTP